MSKYLVIILFLVCSCMDKNKNSHSDKVGEGVKFSTDRRRESNLGCVSREILDSFSFDVAI